MSQSKANRVARQYLDKLINIAAGSGSDTIVGSAHRDTKKKQSGKS
jgi:hypothetical protein